MQPGNLIAPIIVAIGVVAAAVAFALVTTLLDTADSASELRLTRLEEQLAEERASRAAIEEKQRQVEGELQRLRDDLSLIANRAAAAAPAPVPAPGAIGPVGEGEDFETPAETEELTEIMLLARTRFNKSITQPRNRTMIEILGPPRENFSTDCQSVTNPRIAGLLETRTIGPITVTMLRPALDSLTRVLERLRASDPDIYAKIGTAGALCARLIRGSSSAISNHSWGTAIDLTLQDELDRFADGGTQFGLLILAEYFNDEGWFWGATYSREDSMHFEVGEETLRAWLEQGSL